MNCCRMFREYCDMFLDDDNKCSKLNICLVDVYGEEEMLARCVKLGLDKEYEDDYNKIMSRINNKGGEKSDTK